MYDDRTTNPQVETEAADLIFWAEDIATVIELLNLGIAARHFGECKPKKSSEQETHYIFFEKAIKTVEGLEGKTILQHQTPEASIKALALNLQTSGEVFIVPLNNLVTHLLGDRQVFIDTIFKFSNPLSYAEWCTWINQQSLSIDEAADIAKVAIALTPRPSKELENLRKRCGASQTAWRAIVEDLKTETQGKEESSEDDRLRLALLDIAQEQNSIARIRKRRQICSQYRLNKQEVEALIGEVQVKTTQRSLKRMTVDELLASGSEELEWLVPELLPRGEMVILAGSPKAGKSLMAVDVAFAIATGEDNFLGIKCAIGKVLFISNDESTSSTRSKIIKRGFRFGDKNFESINNWTIDRLYELELTLDEFRPDLVIFDSLKSITTNSKISENSAEFANNIYALRNLLVQYKCAGLLIHHTNKNPDAMGVGKLRGSSAIAGACWGTWQLDQIPKPHPNAGKRFRIDPSDPNRLLSVYARDIAGQTFHLEFDPENNSYSRSDSEIIDEQQKIRDRITSLLKLNPQGLRGRDIIEYLQISKEQSRPVYNELNRMEATRQISTVFSDTDRRAIFYTLKAGDDLAKNSEQFQATGEDSLYLTLGVPFDQGYSSENYYQQEFQNSDRSTKNNDRDFENTPTPPSDTPTVISLLEVENSGGNPEEFIGTQVTVIYLVSGAFKRRGEMIDYHRKSGFVTVKEENGKVTDNNPVQEVFVTA